MTIFQRIFLRLFVGVGLLAVCTYLSIEILKDTTIYSVIATLITATTARGIKLIGIACFLICLERGITMNEYKTTITFKSEKPRLVLSTIIDGLYADENLLDYKWDNYKGDSKHKLKITIQSNHGSPSQWIESFAFHETDKIIEIKE